MHSLLVVFFNYPIKGMKRFLARSAVVAKLKELGLYRGEVDNAMVVPICRCVCARWEFSSTCACTEDRASVDFAHVLNIYPFFSRSSVVHLLLVDDDLSGIAALGM